MEPHYVGFDGSDDEEEDDDDDGQAESGSAESGSEDEEYQRCAAHDITHKQFN